MSENADMLSWPFFSVTLKLLTLHYVLLVLYTFLGNSVEIVAVHIPLSENRLSRNFFVRNMYCNLITDIKLLPDLLCLYVVNFFYW